MKCLFVLLLAFMAGTNSLAQTYVQSNYYQPTKGTGLTLNIGTGKANNGGTIETYAGGTKTMTASTTNYVFLNVSESYTPDVNTTGFTPNNVPLAIVVTGSSTITSVADVRTPYTRSPFASTSVAGLAKCDGATTTCTSDGTISASGSISGVQYNPANTIIMWTGDSREWDDAHNTGTIITATAVNCNGTSCTVTASNTLTSGTWIEIYGSFTPGFLLASGGWSGTGNGLYQVIPTGLSSTQFEFSYTANTGTGTGGTIEDASYMLPFYTATLPYFNGHGTTVEVNSGLIQTEAANYMAYFHAYSPAVTGHPGFLFSMGGLNDVSSGRSVAQVESDFISLWEQANTDGWTVVQATIPVFGSGLFSYGFMTTEAIINEWLLAQVKSNANSASGAHFDIMVDLASLLNDAGDPNSTNGLVFSPKGVADAAAAFNAALSNQYTPPIASGIYWDGNGPRLFNPVGSLSVCSTVGAKLCAVNVNSSDNYDTVFTDKLVVNPPSAPFGWDYPPVASITNQYSGTTVGTLGHYAPNLQSGGVMQDVWQKNTNSNNGFYENFGYVSDGSLLNYWSIRFKNAATDAIQVQVTGLTLLAAIQSTGTKFTTSGCGVSSTTGGASAGVMTLGANNCTVVITMNGATGIVASNGWTCHANDKTTAAGNTLLYFPSNNTTTATLSVPMTAGSTDVIDFACTAY